MVQSGEWTRAALLAKKFERDSLAEDYIRMGEAMYQVLISDQAKTGRINYGFHLSLLELMIIKGNFQQAENYINELRQKEISSKGHKLLIEFFGLILNILKGNMNPEAYDQFLEKLSKEPNQLKYWSFQLFNAWLNISNIDNEKKKKISVMTSLMWKSFID